MKNRMHETQFEKLAAWFHDIWAGWYKYQRDRATPENVERWERQARLPYSQLTEEEKDTDRHLAAHVPLVVETHIVYQMDEDLKRAHAIVSAYHSLYRRVRRDVFTLRREKMALLQAADGRSNAYLTLEAERDRLDKKIADGFHVCQACEFKHPSEVQAPREVAHRGKTGIKDEIYKENRRLKACLVPFTIDAKEGMDGAIRVSLMVPPHLLGSRGLNEDLSVSFSVPNALETFLTMARSAEAIRKGLTVSPGELGEIVARIEDLRAENAKLLGYKDDILKIAKLRADDATENDRLRAELKRWEDAFEYWTGDNSKAEIDRLRTELRRLKEHVRVARLKMIGSSYATARSDDRVLKIKDCLAIIDAIPNIDDIACLHPEEEK